MSSQKLTEKLESIDKIVAWFNSDEVEIDEALKKFDELTKLAEDAKKDLSDLENKITVLKQKFDS